MALGAVEIRCGGEGVTVLALGSGPLPRWANALPTCSLCPLFLLSPAKETRPWDGALCFWKGELVGHEDKQASLFISGPFCNRATFCKLLTEEGCTS